MRVGVLLAAVALAAAFAAGVASAPTRPVAVYFLRGGKVAPVRRWVPRPVSVDKAVEALAFGPLGNEDGYTTAVPRGVDVNGVSLRGGIATVDLNRPLDDAAAAQVVYTATQFPAVRSVVLRVNGVATGAARARGAFAASRPEVLVEQPLPDDHVWPLLTVRGTLARANRYVDIDIEAGGEVLEHHVVASPGLRFTLRLGITRKSGLTVVVYPDGDTKDAVRIPIRK